MQPVYNIAEICFRKGVKDIVLSPGSRCAPLTLAFVRHKNFNIYTISDERSAAFMAMGMSLQTDKPSALICTSGTAAYNYAPAVAEAYFQQLPLLILTADRPPEWIGQQDGQTIYQHEIYGKHVKKSYTLPADYSHADSKWYIEKTISEAINLSLQSPKGPVHINIPLREPLYPETEITFDENIKTIDVLPIKQKLDRDTINRLSENIENKKNVLIIAGQSSYNASLSISLTGFLDNCPVPVLADINSNLPDHKNIVRNYDLTLNSADESSIKALQPDLLITFGKSVLSKSLKTFLRKNKPLEHWHLQDNTGDAADPFQTLTSIFPIKPEDFFIDLKALKYENDVYLKLWSHSEQSFKKKIQSFFQTDLKFSEFEAIYNIIPTIPSQSSLFLANSMPVRYAAYLASFMNEKIRVFSNRGTSGIDGTISTATGLALKTSETVTVLTGDMSFFYDRNAFWNNYKKDNLKIIVMNNHGGGIFRIIDGPNKQPELKSYFETEQPLTAQRLAMEVGSEYYHCNNRSDLNEALIKFYSTNGLAILEIETDSNINTEAFCQFKAYIKND